MCGRGILCVASVSLSRHHSVTHSIARAWITLRHGQDKDVSANREQLAISLSKGSEALELGLLAMEKDKHDFASRVLARSSMPPSPCLPHISRGLTCCTCRFVEHGQFHPQLRTGLAALLDCMSVLGKDDLRGQLLQRAVDSNVFKHVLQRPGLLLEELPTDPLLGSDVMTSLAPIISTLEDAAAELTREWASAWARDSALTREDSEQLSVAGRWQQLVLVRNGRADDKMWARFPAAARTLRPLIAQHAADMPKGSVEISTIQRTCWCLALA